MKLPVIGITMGDFAGIGPEVVVKSLSDDAILSCCIPVVLGAEEVFAATAASLASPVKPVALSEVGRDTLVPGTVYLLQCSAARPAQVTMGVPAGRWGKEAFLFVRTGAALASQGAIDGLVTAPISKEGIRKAGFEYHGHTEFLAFLTNTHAYRMLFVGGGLKVILATIHIPLKEVFHALNADMLEETIEMAREASRLFGVAQPHIAVSGLNPHAGEGGMFGTEESDVIMPAIERARKKGIRVTGPLPPDTVFLSARKGEFDFVVALYHDQGLIAFKMVAFDAGVNMTLGLPIIRTSPDHGTAYGIAGKGIADPGSMKAAITLAAQLAKNKT
jgi:4-hydroxythreonine-4-phosphate dehydrogenase